MIPPNLVSKIISSVAVGMLFLNILFSGYITSLLKKQINKNDFSISQSLAFGQEISLVVLFVIFIMLTCYLVIYRKMTKVYTIINIILLIIICAFVITIVWITMHKSTLQHSIFASIIFLALYIFVILNAVNLWKNTPNKKIYQKVLILIIPILISLSMIGLITGVTLSYNKKQLQVFPSFENIVIVLGGLSILELGFI